MSKDFAARRKKDEEINALIEKEIEAFTEEFSNIPVIAGWSEGGQSRNETIYVRPPYFMNLLPFKEGNGPQPRPKTIERYKEAEENRNHAPQPVKDLLSQVPSKVLKGKSTPDDIRELLQKAVRSDLIRSENGLSHPNSEDIRNWLKKYGIGVDCSGFASQVLNRVTQRAYEASSMSPPHQLSIDNTSSADLKGGEGRKQSFIRVRTPSDLRPADTMQIESKGKSEHVRIIEKVTTTPEGYIEFTTVESSGRANGINEATWRYKNKDSFTGLQTMKKEASKQINPWEDERGDKEITYGHYRDVEDYKTTQE